MALSVSRLVRVLVNLSPLAAARRSFGILLIAGDSNVINGVERLRSYDTVEGVADDFGVNAPEYKAAAAYFGQTPKPRSCMIGRWIRIDSAGQNIGGILTAAEQAMGNWTGITNGGFTISIDGVSQDVLGLDFSAQTNLNGVASEITSGLSGAVCTWDGSKFTITSSTTGASSAVGYATTPPSGTDISAQIKMTSTLSILLVPGFDAETPVEAAAVFADMSALWYGLMFNASVQPSTPDNLDVSAFIEALDIKRIFGVTIIDPSVLSALVTNDLASQLKAAGFLRSFTQYSQNVVAIASFIGRAFSVDFNANRSTITLMYKQEPSITGEDLTATEANVLQDKRCNVFVDYVNDTKIIQYGTMAGPAYFDEIHGLDWLQDAVQNACYNLMFQSPTKIPQTDDGMNQFVNVINQTMDQAVNNGLVGPGTWSADGFGQLARGDFLKTGYYVFANSLALQSQADREQRKAPPIQIAAKLAGAIQELDVVINVNR